MEVDDIQTPQQARKFSRVNSNGARIDSSKIALEPPTTTTTQDNKTHPTTTTTTSAAAATTSTTTDLVAATANRLRQWPHHQSRIIRVSRASGGKDRHSKVWTARGPRDRRVRLSVNTAIQFYDLQDRLGYEQPSKAVEWLIKAAADAINELPSLDTCATFPPDTPCQLTHNPAMADNNNSADRDPDGEDNDPTHPGQNPASKSGCSSNNSENSKGSSGLSLSRTEIRVKARERARERTAKEKEKDGGDQTAPARVHVSGGHHQTSSFTQLLTAGISRSPASSSPPGTASLSPDVGLFHHKHTRGGTTTTSTTTTATATTTANQWLASNITAMDYFGNAAGGLLGSSSSSSSSRQMQQQQIPQAMAISPHSLHNHHQQNQQQFPFVSGAGDHLIQVLPNNHHNTGGAGGGGNVYNFNFSISSSTATSSGAGYNNRGTLQSNSPSLLPYLQRFSTTDGLSSVPFFLGGAPVSSTSDDHHHHQFQPPGLQLCYGDGARHQSDHKGTTKN